MKILYIHQYFGTPQDAAGTRSYSFSKGLIENGHQVTMVYMINDRMKSILKQKKQNEFVSRGIYEGINLDKKSV